MGISKKIFGYMPDGAAVYLYTLMNKNGTRVEVMPYGGRMVRILTKDRNGDFGDIVLGFDTFDEYISHNNYHGAVLGRYANRIGGGRFTVDGTEYSLDLNEGAYCLHGGKNGFQQILWDVEGAKGGDEPSVTFTHTSPDGDMGFPGNLSVRVTYTLTAEDVLRVDFNAVTDKKTPVNLSSHPYFNLCGDLKRDVLETELLINSGAYTAVGDDIVPTGELVPVDGTPFDFRAAKPIGRDIGADDRILKLCHGYDHNFTVAGGGLKLRAEAYDPATGRTLALWSEMPAVQLYTCNWPTPGCVYKGGAEPFSYQAFCLEPQFYPDSPNHPEFPFQYLAPGEEYHRVNEYRFGVR